MADKPAAKGQENTEEAGADMPLVDFDVVVGGKERFDVCRLFLASLQLVSLWCDTFCMRSLVLPLCVAVARHMTLLPACHDMMSRSASFGLSR